MRDRSEAKSVYDANTTVGVSAGLNQVDQLKFENEKLKSEIHQLENEALRLYRRLEERY